jgi:hypothetical protein
MPGSQRPDWFTIPAHARSESNTAAADIVWFANTFTLGDRHVFGTRSAFRRTEPCAIDRLLSPPAGLWLDEVCMTIS